MTQRGNEERFFDLETKVAYQEKLLAELSDVLAEQTKELEDLRRRLAAVESAVREAKDESSAPLPHERPPHY